MNTRYTHLQPEERVILAALRQQGQSLRSIARILGRNAATLSRELARNGDAQGYASRPAQQACQLRRQRARTWRKLHPESALWTVVTQMLLWRWSPQQIARILKRMCIDPAVSAQVKVLKHKPQRGSSCQAPVGGAGGCKSRSSLR